jgi:hypothetical protein
VSLGPAPTILRSGVDRVVPVIVANPPRAEAYGFVTRAANKIQAECVSFWRGRKVLPRSWGLNRGDNPVPVSPPDRVIDRHSYFLHTSHLPTPPKIMRKEKGPIRWQFVWPQELYEFFARAFPGLLLTDEECLQEWIDDHVALKTTCSLVNVGPSPYTHLFAPPPDPLLPLRQLVGTLRSLL